jgi:hypothetical protein
VNLTPFDRNTEADAWDALFAAGAQTSFRELSSAPVGAARSLGIGPYRY